MVTTDLDALGQAAVERINTGRFGAAVGGLVRDLREAADRIEELATTRPGSDAVERIVQHLKRAEPLHTVGVLIMIGAEADAIAARSTGG